MHIVDFNDYILILLQFTQKNNHEDFEDSMIVLYISDSPTPGHFSIFFPLSQNTHDSLAKIQILYGEGSQKRLYHENCLNVPRFGILARSYFWHIFGKIKKHKWDIIHQLS